MIGTAFFADRARAKAVGYALHFAFGMLFALVYYALFRTLGEASWWLGALFGAAHALFAGTTLINVLLPAIHPRMGTSITAADEPSDPVT